MNDIIYIADIADDIDDMVAIYYLQHIGRLKCVVWDGKTECAERITELEKSGIQVLKEIPEGTRVVFCGGALTPITEYLLKGSTLHLVVVNGFFAGSNIVPKEHILSKFNTRTSCPSYNPNLDPESAIYVLNNAKFPILVVSKNVCHHPDNVIGKWHNEDFFKGFDISPTKKLHDVLMVKEGLNIVDNKETLCEYYPVNIYAQGEGNSTRQQWTSVFNPESTTEISIFYKNHLQSPESVLN